jgi:E3 ubiquitin-protein ligase HUWE1
MVSLDLIAIFTPRELELLISGLPDIDVHDLRQNTEYQGYRATDKEIQWFWNVMFSLSRSEKAAFLQFVTGSAKVPLAGFAELQGMRGVQKFSIHKVGGSSGALMSAHTCFNSLDLPVYKSEEELREKLLYAISEGGGAFMFA